MKLFISQSTQSNSFKSKLIASVVRRIPTQPIGSKTVGSWLTWNYFFRFCNPRKFSKETLNLNVSLNLLNAPYHSSGNVTICDTGDIILSH